MKKTIIVILFSIVCQVGFSQNPLWKNAEEIPISARADLDVRWDVISYIPTNKWPAKLWVYQLAPRKLSPENISNLMQMCSFTERDRVQQDTNGVTFKSPDSLRTLAISFPSGTIRCDTPEPRHIRMSSVFKDVPEEKEMPKLIKKFAQKIGIRLSEIRKNTNGVLNFPLSDLGRMYFTNHTRITIIWAREVFFRRAVDGVEVIGNAGYCWLDFGEHAKISRIDLSWPDLKRCKSATTLKPQAITDLIRQGKTFQGSTFDNVGYIDWPSVKSVTIKQAWPCYFAGDTDTLYPFLALWTQVDTGHGTVEVGIDCPIIDETKL